jgi:hypothetical protein
MEIALSIIGFIIGHLCASGPAKKDSAIASDIIRSNSEESLCTQKVREHKIREGFLPTKIHGEGDLLILEYADGRVQNVILPRGFMILSTLRFTEGLNFDGLNRIKKSFFEFQESKL